MINNNIFNYWFINSEIQEEFQKLINNKLSEGYKIDTILISVFCILINYKQEFFNKLIEEEKTEGLKWMNN